MPQQTKIFRVFVSSTFTDMKEERRILQKQVFPKLEAFCESKGAKFQAVDLRWGVNEESQLDQKTMDICLNEIARCQRISPKPNFIILLGDRYGWQPLPEKIPANEMEEIFNKLSSDKKNIVEKWYWLDENAVPAEYVLQPRENEFKEYCNWEKIENELRNILRDAVSKCEFSPEEKIKYFASATHQEIINGALNPPDGTEKPEEHVFAYIRDVNNLPKDNSAKDFIDLTDNAPDPYCKGQLDKLKVELKEKLGDHYIQYDASWEGEQTKINFPRTFARKTYKYLRRIIDKQLQGIITTDEIEHEVKLHQEFKEKLTEHFSGRVNILSEIKNYLNSATDNKVLSIIGKSGSGKSSVMAQAIKECEKGKKNAAIICRFIGTSSRSSNIVTFLQSICGEIAKEYDKDLKKIAGEDTEKKLNDLQGLTEIFSICLAMGTEEKPIILFLDALDQFPDNDNARALTWLRRELPSNVKVIVSSLPELKEKLNDTNILILPVLPEQEAIQILDKWLEVNKRKLQPRQKEELLKKFSLTGNAIYLKLAFERAKHWHSFDDVKGNILKSDVKGIINDYFGYLEREHTKELVRNVICYMLCGRYRGLAENEILEILFFDKEYKTLFLKRTFEGLRKEIEDSTKIPIVVWSRLYLDLEPFLTVRDADGVPIITFFHRQFFEVLSERYQLIEELVEN